MVNAGHPSLFSNQGSVLALIIVTLVYCGDAVCYLKFCSRLHTSKIVKVFKTLMQKLAVCKSLNLLNSVIGKWVLRCPTSPVWPPYINTYEGCEWLDRWGETGEKTYVFAFYISWSGFNLVLKNPVINYARHDYERNRWRHSCCEVLHYMKEKYSVTA